MQILVEEEMLNHDLKVCQDMGGMRTLDHLDIKPRSGTNLDRFSENISHWLSI